MSESFKKIKKTRREFLSLSKAIPLLIFLKEGSAFAEVSAADAKTRWNQLSEPERQTLLKRWEQFKALPPARQTELRQAEIRFRNLPEENRNRILKNMVAWNHLSDEQKTHLRTAYQNWSKLSPSEKESLDQRYQKWKSLPESKREKIRRDSRREK